MKALKSSLTAAEYENTMELFSQYEIDLNTAIPNFKAVGNKLVLDKVIMEVSPEGSVSINGTELESYTPGSFDVYMSCND